MATEAEAKRKPAGGLEVNVSVHDSFGTAGASAKAMQNFARLIQYHMVRALIREGNEDRWNLTVYIARERNRAGKPTATKSAKSQG